MSDVVTRLHNIRDHLRSGRFGEREVWEADLDAAAAEIERLKAALQALADDASVPPWIRTLARRALEPKP